MITIENLSKSFGKQELFNDISFKINKKERVGLVGRNGHGKTTLFKLITGEEAYDDGLIMIPKHYRIGYVKQQIEFTEKTVIDEGLRALPEAIKDHRWKLEKILAGLGFSQSDFLRNPNEFSGGFQVRLNLAKVLTSEPDLLLLDEPTNYLDITSIRWIESFLVSWPHELILITHDRSFMDKITTHTMAIHRKKIRKIKGNTEKLYTQIVQDEEIYEKTRVNDERKQREMELFIRRFRAKARLANLVQSRIKSLEKMEKKDRLEKIKDLEFSFRSRAFNGKFILTAENINFSYSSNQNIINNFNINIEANDRICVIGKNGKGKTTLLKILANVLKFKTGNIKYHKEVRKGFFEQTNIKSLIDERTVEQEILYSHYDVDNQMARNICGAMMFEGEAALKKVKVLSGGEKSRVMLGKLLLTPVNLLLLDEPTNHLDMQSCDALLAAIDNFDGAVIMVTHNEMFLHALAQRLIVFKNNGIMIFEGTYQSFLEKEGFEDEHDSITRTSNSINLKQETITKEDKKQLKRKRAELLSEKSKTIKPLEIKIKNIENKINDHEKNIEKNNIKMQEACLNKNSSEIENISRSIHNSQSEIEQLFDDLELYTEKFENSKKIFDNKLEELNYDL